MKRFQYLFLSLYISICAFSITCTLFTVIHNAWMSVFCASATAVFFCLHTMELERLLKLRDEEILALKKTTADTIMVRTNELHKEIHRLLNPAPPRIWRRNWKSCTNLDQLDTRAKTGRSRSRHY